MKRWIYATVDPEGNPKDAAEATIKQLNSDLTAIGNIVKKYGKQYENHIDDDAVMLEIVDNLAFMQKAVDSIRDHYGLNH